jgi:hypothetical protein
MRKAVIVGPPMIRVLDIMGPLEVLSNAQGYKIQLANPGLERSLQTNRRMNVSLRIELVGDVGPFLWEVDVSEVDVLDWFELQGLDETLTQCLSYELPHRVSPDSEQVFG